MVPNDDEQCIISKQADDYEKSQGEAFSRPLAIKDRARKNPVNWWGAYGGLVYELMSLAKKIVSLCCSASGCERNWSTFSQIHTKRRNRLEHKRLNSLVFVSYNRKMANRFAKLRELGSKGKKYNPLHLDEFQWENEWVDAGCEPVHQDAASDTGNYLTWQNVDEATGATQGLGGRNLPRAAAMKRKSGSKHAAAAAASKRTKQPRTAAIPVEDEVSSEEDDEMGDESGSDYEDDEEGGGGSAAGAFQVDDAVL
ncbi:uncharacterized protein LOC121776435 [Salvia splendens]|uniref:uncharacterized protein LOC121776435 n=1 Tax=Salvia splendens TaxID=180675 RepID=UPI001C25ABCF|nr:uncharacterized protein LOC121776435 [Salvia splendens]